MIVDNSVNSTMFSRFNSRKTPGTAARGEEPSKVSDSVDISPEALAATNGAGLAVSSPSALVSEHEIKWDLARIFMETLFGSESDKNAKSAEDELIQAITSQQTFEDTLQDAVQKKLSALDSGKK